MRAKRRELQERRETLLAEARALETGMATIDRCVVLLDPAAVTPSALGFKARLTP